ncbi:MAG: HAD hydrolase-like protein [Lachnospiraceae bacterium]|nr:HAD hydrolase-like protein [Lachnospiraceae bacterium]
MKKYILFDLDGTVTDPKVGITTCVQYALKDFGIVEEDLDKLEPFIGPPLKDSFMQYYDMTEEQASKAVEKYRERFQDTGIFENELYGGIHDLLRTLKAGGLHLAVASSKPTVFVERILKHFKIDKYFEVVVGSELNGERVEKVQVIQEVLHRFFPGGQPRYDEVYMVGDRKFDVDGAKTFRIETVGVTYGYGSMEELKDARADYIVNSVGELKKLLMREVEAVQRKQAEEGGGDNGKPEKSENRKILWRMMLPFVLFFVAKGLASSVMSIIIQTICNEMPVLEKYLVVKDEASDVMYFSGNAYAMCQAVSFLAAAAIVWNYAKGAITKTADEVRLLHIKKEPVKNYVIIGVSSLAAVIGMNLIITLSGIVEMDEAYQIAAEMQYSSAVWLGLIVYGVLAPIAEELMFRGIFYNCLRRTMKIPFAMVVSAFLFSVYHSNTSQTMYAAVIGFIMAYAYEAFGNFLVPLAIHVGANMVVYIMTRAGINETAFVSMPVAVVALVIAVVGLFVLEREKRLLKFALKA